MGLNKGKMEAPVSIADVKSALGMATNDLLRLCQGRVRKWARCKPTNFVVDSDPLHSEKTLLIPKGGSGYDVAMNNIDRYYSQPLYPQEPWKGDRRDIYEEGADGDEGVGTRTVISYVQEYGFIIPCADEDTEPTQESLGSTGVKVWKRTQEQQDWWKTRTWQWIPPLVGRLTDFVGYTTDAPVSSSTTFYADIAEEYKVRVGSNTRISLKNPNFEVPYDRALFTKDFENLADAYFCIAIEVDDDVYEFRSDDTIGNGEAYQHDICYVDIPWVFFREKTQVAGSGLGLVFNTYAYARKGSRLISLATGPNYETMHAVRYKYQPQYVYVRYEIGVIEGGANARLLWDGTQHSVYLPEYDFASKSSGYKLCVPSFYIKGKVEKSTNDIDFSKSTLKLRVTVRNNTRFGSSCPKIPTVVMPLSPSIDIKLNGWEDTATNANKWSKDCCFGMTIESSSGINDNLKSGYLDSRNGTLFGSDGEEFYWEGEPTDIPIVLEGMEVSGKSFPRNICFGIEGELYIDGIKDDLSLVIGIPQAGNGLNDTDGSENQYNLGLNFGTSTSDNSVDLNTNGGTFPTGTTSTARYNADTFNKDTWLPRPDDVEWAENYKGIDIV